MNTGGKMSIHEMVQSERIANQAKKDLLIGYRKDIGELGYCVITYGKKK